MSNDKDSKTIQREKIISKNVVAEKMVFTYKRVKLEPHTQKINFKNGSKA